MPTILKAGPYRFYFFSHETDEPPHVHVDRENCSAKFWIETGALARNTGLRPHELREVQAIVHERRQEFLEAWNGHFGS